MERFKELVSLCKGSVMLEVNPHKDFYDSVEYHFAHMNNEVDKDIMDIMIDRDTIIHIQAYPHTPISFYSVYHYDLDTALDRMLELIRDEFN